jgi:23S rRNA (cytosine1962-C5)-methyltransferase
LPKSADYFSLLRNAIALRSSVAEKNTAYRLVNGAPDGFPGLTLDRYGSHYQLQFFGSELLAFRTEIVSIVGEQLVPEFLVSKFRLDAAGKALETPSMVVEMGASDNASTVVEEGDCLFHVNLLDTVNPGLFLDMREGREDVQKRSQGREILNLFSYTCSFGVHARMGGAALAVNADISAKILEKGRENYVLNGLEIYPHEFFRGNAREYLEWCVKKERRFGGIILDPPSFARYKGTTFRVRDDLQSLVALAASLLEPGGFLLVSSNFSGFSPKQLAEISLVTVRAQRSRARLAWAHSQGPDFPGSGSMKESCLSAAMILT